MRVKSLRSVLLLGVCAFAVPVLAQVQSIERRGDSTQRQIPAPAPALPRVEVQGAAPDTTGVWHFVRTGDATAARRELIRLQAAFPNWTPPADLLTNIARLENPVAAPARTADNGYARQLTELTAAVKAGQTAGRETALARLEQNIIQRRDAGAAEVLGWAYVDGADLVRAQHWFERAEGWGAPDTARQGQVRAVAAQGRFEDAERIAGANAALRTIIADQAADTAQTKAKGGDWTAAIAAAAVAERNGLAGATASLGWIALAAGSLGEAKQAFATATTEDATYGAILVLDQSKAPWPEIDAFCTARLQSDRQREACANALSNRALGAYQAENWAETIAIDAAMGKLKAARPGIGALAAWSQYRQGHFATAAQQFDRLYRNGEDVADGLVLASLADGRAAAMAARAKTDPKIAVLYRSQESAQALARKKFQLAATLDDGKNIALTNTAAPDASVGVAYREKTGTAGQDALRVTSVTARGAYGWDADHLTISVADLRVRIGTPATNTPVGSLQPRRFAATAGDVLYVPTVSWQHDTVDSRVSITAGTTPVGGVVQASPVGQFQWQQSGASFITTFTAKAAPVYESLLSMSGMIDPVTGAPWGRVVDIGPQLAVTYLASESVALSGSIEGAALRGKNVANNSRIGGSLSLSYQLTPAGFDYVRVGPSYAYQHYAKNQFFFTYGNGGYYSPDQLHTVGGFLDFQTAEAQRWQFAARISGGWTHKVEAAALQFPLTGTGLLVGGVRGSELSVDSVARASVMLSDYLRLGLYGRYTQAPSGKDRAAAVVLSIPFGRRAATFSSDLPQILDRSWP